MEKHTETWKKIKAKFLNTKKKSAHKKEDIKEWFKLYNLLYKLDYIKLKSRQNIDKTSFRIGCLTHTQLIIIRKNIPRPRLEDPNSRESVISIKYILIINKQIPPLIIFAGKVFISQIFSKLIPRNQIITYTKKGSNTIVLRVEWIKYFDKHTKRQMELDEKRWQRAKDNKSNKKDV